MSPVGMWTRPQLSLEGFHPVTNKAPDFPIKLLDATSKQQAFAQTTNGSHHQHTGRENGISVAASGGEGAGGGG